MSFRKTHVLTASVLVVVGGVLSGFLLLDSWKLHENVISSFPLPRIGSHARIVVVENSDERFDPPHNVFFSLRVERSGSRQVILVPRMDSPPVNLLVRGDLVYMFREIDGGFHLDCFNIVTGNQVSARYSDSLNELKSFAGSGP